MQTERDNMEKKTIRSGAPYVRAGMAVLLMALDRLFGLDRLFVGTGKG